MRLNTNEWHPRWTAPDHELATIAVAPISTNPRMTTQQAAFTLMGDSFLPLDHSSSADDSSPKARWSRLSYPPRVIGKLTNTSRSPA